MTSVSKLRAPAAKKRATVAKGKRTSGASQRVASVLTQKTSKTSAKQASVKHASIKKVPAKKGAAVKVLASAKDAPVKGNPVRGNPVKGTPSSASSARRTGPLAKDVIAKPRSSASKPLPKAVSKSSPVPLAPVRGRPSAEVSLSAKKVSSSTSTSPVTFQEQSKQHAVEVRPPSAIEPMASHDLVGEAGQDMGPLPNDEVFDETDSAQHLQLREQADVQRRARLMNQPESHPDFDGTHCVDCDAVIPEARLALQRIRCVLCQQDLENLAKKQQARAR
jgi:RNA polymerase-binding transcription factor DksA